MTPPRTSPTIGGRCCTALWPDAPAGRVKQFVQLLFRAAYKQLIRLANVPTLRGIAALDEQDKRLEKIHLSAVPEVVSAVAAGVADDNVAEKLRHQLLPVDLGQAVPRI